MITTKKALTQLFQGIFRIKINRATEMTILSYWQEKGNEGREAKQVYLIPESYNELSLQK